LSKLNNITFYIQVSSSIGIGHLSRSSCLIKGLKNKGIKVTVKLSADDFGICEANLRNLHNNTKWYSDTDKSVVIIDAVHVNESDIKALMLFDKRIVISPIFNRFDIATHVFVRDMSNEMRRNLPSRVSLHESFAFSFATSKNLNKKDLKFKRLKIGICLSGGKIDNNINTLLNIFNKVDNIDEVRIIDRRAPHVDTADHNYKISVIAHTDRPWNFMSSVNVFIGGEGVMLSEAIAQGIPTISLGNKGFKCKSEKLEDSGALKMLSKNPIDELELIKILSDNNCLHDMHISAINAMNSNMPDSLINEIFNNITS
jgi:spore coat polysaccharide biosynthesis predicted glycosyltransferase SpsG